MVVLKRLHNDDLFDNVHIDDRLYYHVAFANFFCLFKVVKITKKRAVLRSLSQLYPGERRYLLSQNFIYYYRPVLDGVDFSALPDCIFPGQFIKE